MSAMTQATEFDNPHTRGIARFVSALDYRRIPPEVIGRIKLLMLDSLGCALYAADRQWSCILQERLGLLDTTRACTVWGTRLKLSAPHAALLNGTQIQGFELDDVHRRARMHIGASVIPALFAIAETFPGMNGRDFLVAAVAGYEVGPRVAMCMGGAHADQGWHSTATLGVFAAAAAAARAMKLDVDKTVHALGIAGTQASGLLAAQYGAMVKRMHTGRASQSGLYGALLADAGFTGIANIFESEYGGFCTTFSRSTDNFKLDELNAGFGSTWHTMEVALKFYSCVASSHTALDAIHDMRRERPFKAGEIRKIVVHASKVTMEHAGWPYVPQGLTSAQMNLSYCVATFLLEGDCSVDQFTEDKVADPARMALAAKVEVQHDPAITEKGPRFRHMTHVEAHFLDGTVMKRTVEAARGNENAFAPDADIVSKFQKLGSHTLPLPQVEQLRDAMLTLDEISDVAAVVRLLQLH